MTILVAVKKNDRVYLGADRITTFGNEYSTDLVNGSKIIKLKHAYLATSGYTLLDNVIEHLYAVNHKMMENTFKNRAEVFSFFLELFGELKKNYTLVDVGKDTYATMYNVFLVVTPNSIYGISNNLAVHEYERFAAKGAGADYAQGCLYGIFDLMEDGFEVTRLALEAACHFSIYCKEPLDILYVDAKEFGGTKGGYKQHQTLKTMHERQGTGDLIAVTRSTVVLNTKVKDFSNGKGRVKAVPKASTKKSETAKRKKDVSLGVKVGKQVGTKSRGSQSQSQGKKKSGRK
jgi:ATP-dependent protease HslVU (ClpYQ) peptidase subunit